MARTSYTTICIVAVLIGLCLLLVSLDVNRDEHFTVEVVKSLSLLRGDPKKVKTVDRDPNDHAFVRLYDTVFNTQPVFDHDIKRIKNITKMDKDSKILDAGCGVGRHTKALLEQCPGAKIESVDHSYQMIKRARIRNPGAEFVTASLTGVGLYRPLSLTHILALHETLQANSPSDLGKILYNFHAWLQPGGYLLAHIMDPNKLDPAPREFSQYYRADDDARHSLTYFEAFTHEAWWEKDPRANWYRYCQKFIFPRGQAKTVTQAMWIPPVNQMLKMITNHGFRLREIIELKDIGIQDFSLYVFRKTGKVKAP